jgi:sulfoxide reductase heme-binding subunit YedZ
MDADAALSRSPAAATTRRRTAAPYRWLAPGVVAGALAPLLSIVLRAARGELGADPIAQALNELGLVALIFLTASLVCTPAKSLFGWTWPIRLRRMLGLLAALYATLHVLTYAVLDQGLDLHAIVDDVLERKFILAGAATYLMLLPLALTSTNAAVRRLGFARWKRLHRLAYLAGAVAALHFIWRVKKDLREPAVYAIVIGALLLARLAARIPTRLGHARVAD